MSYQTYITDAVVVGSFPNNTADKTFLLFTERLGLVYATARSVREERSRQRYALQDFSYIFVTLVKGNGGWRIGSVDTYGNFYQQAMTRSARGSVVQLTKVLRRYVHGEIPEPALYQEFVASLQYMTSITCTDTVQIGLTLCASVRVLSKLGYVAQGNQLLKVLEPTLATIPIDLIIDLQPLLESTYREAQAVTHLEQ